MMKKEQSKFCPFLHSNECIYHIQVSLEVLQKMIIQSIAKYVDIKRQVNIFLLVKVETG